MDKCQQKHFLIKVAATELQADTESKRQGPVEEAPVVLEEEECPILAAA